MNNQKIKYQFITTIFALSLILISLFFHHQIYDLPLWTIFTKKFGNNANSAHKVIELKLDKAVDSACMLELFKYTANCAESIVVDENINFKNYNYIDEINAFIGSSNKIIGTVKASNNKSIIPNGYNQKNSMYIKTNENFYISNCKITNEKTPLRFQSNFAPYNLSNTNDFIYKTRTKYLYSLPFALFLQLSKHNSPPELHNSKVTINKKIYHYNSSGRFYFNDVNVKFDKEEIKYSKLEEALKARSQLNEILIKLELIDNLDKTSYKNIEKIINKLPYRNFHQQDKIELHANAMQLLPIWSVFKDEYKTFKKSIVFLGTQEEVISNTIKKLYLLEYERSLKTPLYSITFLITLALFFLLLMISFRSKSIWVISLSYLLIVTLNIFIYRIMNRQIGVFYPITGVIIYSLLGVTIGTLIKICYRRCWLSFINFAIGVNASQDFKKTIIEEISQESSENITNKESYSIYACINQALYVKQTAVQQTKYINELLNESENRIKEAFGIIDQIGKQGIQAYFPVMDKKKTNVNSITSVVDKLLENNPNETFRIAIHFTNEPTTLSTITNSTNLARVKRISDTPILLAGIEKGAQRFEVSTIVTGSFLKSSEEALPVRMLDRVLVDGTNCSERLFELIHQRIYDHKEELVDYFHAGLKLFESQQWSEAANYFQHCLRIDSNDTPSAIYLERCKEFLYIPPPSDWNGIFTVK